VTRRRFLALLAAGLVVCAIALEVVIATSPAAFVRVSPASLAHSVHKHTPSAEMGWCRPRGEAEWRCSTIDSSHQGTALYDVHVEGDCWRGHLEPGSEHEGYMPESASGCVSVRDMLRLSERLFDR
jgi:hypothetical protein